MLTLTDKLIARVIREEVFRSLETTAGRPLQDYWPGEVNRFLVNRRIYKVAFHALCPPALTVKVQDGVGKAASWSLARMSAWAAAQKFHVRVVQCLDITLHAHERSAKDIARLALLLKSFPSVSELHVQPTKCQGLRQRHDLRVLPLQLQSLTLTTMRTSMIDFAIGLSVLNTLTTLCLYDMELESYAGTQTQSWSLPMPQSPHITDVRLWGHDHHFAYDLLFSILPNVRVLHLDCIVKASVPFTWENRIPGAVQALTIHLTAAHRASPLAIRERIEAAGDAIALRRLPVLSRLNLAASDPSYRYTGEAWPYASRFFKPCSQVASIGLILYKDDLCYRIISGLHDALQDRKALRAMQEISLTLESADILDDGLGLAKKYLRLLIKELHRRHFVLVENEAFVEHQVPKCLIRWRLRTREENRRRKLARRKSQQVIDFVKNPRLATMGVPLQIPYVAGPLPSSLFGDM